MKSLYVVCFTMLLFSCTTNESAKVHSASLQEQLPSLKGKEILIVYGGWDGHKPQVFAQLMQQQLEELGAEVESRDTTAIYSDSAALQVFDLIIQSITMDQITNEQMQGLSNAVKSGIGFAGAHGGFADAFRANTEYQYMTGGQFVAHPGGQINFKVNISNHDHLITQGVDDFETYSEQYYLHVDPNVEVLASTTFDGSYDNWIKDYTMPVAWTKSHGGGKVFFLSVGHNPKEFESGPDRQLLLNGFRWAAR